jgi:hypothetical protein
MSISKDDHDHQEMHSPNTNYLFCYFSSLRGTKYNNRKGYSYTAYVIIHDQTIGSIRESKNDERNLCIVERR